MLLWVWVLAIGAALALYLRKVYSKFSDGQVNSLPYIPLFGHFGKLIFKMEHIADQLSRQYNAFPDDRFIGYYEILNPLIIVRDIELIKKVTVKDFDYFLDHRTFVDAKADPLFGRNLFSMKGQEWKDMRSTLSPAFTSSKIRLMVPFIVEVGDQMIKTLKSKIDKAGVGYLDVETKDLVTRYANDVIASCAFGLKVDSLTDENNQFYQLGKVASNFTFYQMLKMFGVLSFPAVSKLFNISLFTEDTKSFFRKLVNTTMKEREKHDIIRPDMIQLLMEAKKGTLSHDTNSSENAGFATVEESNVGRTKIDRVWTDDELVAQAILFFIAGFDTVATTMSFLLHELALNPDVQDKLVSEIKQNDAKNSGKFDYTSIQDMQYMDMAVSEVLRLWPPAVGLDRICTKDYNLGRPNAKATKDYIIHRGEALQVPVWPIHRNPDYFPDPNKFDPERFSEENKHTIQPFTYNPFGLGPRNCIASRFALCEVKVMVYQLLKEMELSPYEKTCIPTKLANDSFDLRIRGGHWLRIRARKV